MTALDRNLLMQGIRITRTGNAGTYVDSDGVIRTALANVLRITHDPITKEPLGALLEGVRTNLFTWSEAIDNAAWTKARVTVDADISIAPDGTLTADKIVENTDNNSHVWQQNWTSAAGTTYCHSFFLKAAGRNFVRGILSSGQFPATAVIRFDLVNGVITEQSSGAFVGAGMIPYPNGWWRCWYAATADKTALATAQLRLCTTGTGGTDTYLGDGVSGVYCWGAVREVGAFPSSYIKTESSTVTRGPDFMSRPYTPPSEFTVLLEGVVPPAHGGNSVVWATGPTFNDTIYVNRDNLDRFTLILRSGGVSIGSVAIAGITPNAPFKLAVRVKNNDTIFCVNGSNLSTVISGTPSYVTVTEELGADWAGTANRWFSTIRKRAIIPRALSNSELQALTS